MNEELQNLLQQPSYTLYIIALFAGLSLFFFIIVIQQLQKMVMEEDRSLAIEPETDLACCTDHQLFFLLIATL